MTIASSQSVPPANNPRRAPRRGDGAAFSGGQRGHCGTSAAERPDRGLRRLGEVSLADERELDRGRQRGRQSRAPSWATSAAGGLDTTTISSVLGSSSRACSAAMVERPATALDRSRPPTPSAAVTPTPAASSRHSSCWQPVPDAATMPTGPGSTECENPRPTPPITAVPQSGPRTSSPRSAATSFSRTSCSTGTLSEKTITSHPASRASIASVNACRPGTEINASPA